MPELNLGKVVGPQGPQGVTGPAGAQGEQGIQGVPGKDAAINGYNTLTLTAGGAAQLTQDGGNAVITASGRNLLDNWYFAAPINQRGQTEYSGAGDTIDRWRLNGTGASVLVEDTCIRLKSANSFYQRMEYVEAFRGKTVTFSMLIECVVPGAGHMGIICDNQWVDHTTLPRTPGEKTVVSATVAIPEDASKWHAWYYGGEGTDYRVYAAKLELGSTQTLARNIGTEEQPNWVLNDPPPDKAMELAKCQRYQPYMLNGDHEDRMIATVFAQSGTAPSKQLWGVVCTPVSPRANGSLPIEFENIIVTDGCDNTSDVESFLFAGKTPNGFYIIFKTVDAIFTPGQAYVLKSKSNCDTRKLFITCNLL